MTELTPTEHARRDALRLSKPKAYAKILRFPEILAAGKAVTQLQIQARRACNFYPRTDSRGVRHGCKHCFATALEDGRPELTLDEIRGLVDQADAYGLAQITLTGGEPLMWPDLEGVIESLTPTRFTIAIDTNGWFLAEKADWLAAHGVDKMQVSIDSLDPKEHDAFRDKPGSWQRAVDGVEAALRAGLRVIASTCITDERVVSDEFIAYMSWANGMGCEVFANPLRPTGEWQTYGLATQFCLDKAREYQDAGWGIFQHSLPQGYGMSDAHGGDACIAVWRQMYVTSSGNCHPCPTIPLTLGNIREESLETIITRGLDMGYRNPVKGCPGMYHMTGLEENYEKVRLGDEGRRASHH